MKLLIWIFARLTAFVFKAIKYTDFLTGFIKYYSAANNINSISMINDNFGWLYGFDCYMEGIFIIIFLIDPEFRQAAKDFLKFTIFRQPLSEAYIQ